MPYTAIAIPITGSQPMTVDYDPSTFPIGMVFDVITKEIKGTPAVGTAGGSSQVYHLKITASNPDPSSPVVQIYDVTVVAPVLPVFTTASLPDAMRANPLAYTQTIATDDPIANLALVGFPPAWVTLTPIPSTGTAVLDIAPNDPPVAGVFPITVRADNGQGYTDQTYNLRVVAPLPAPDIVDASLSAPAGTAGDAYVGVTLQALNSPSSWAWTGTTPPGLSLGAGGMISGTPTTAGTYAFAVTATNPAGPSAPKTVTILINPAPANVPPPLANYLSDAERGVEYRQEVSTVTRPDIVWTISEGALPRGLTLEDDVISGIPEQTGAFTFTVSASSAGSLFPTVEKTFSLTVPSTTVINISRTVLIPSVSGVSTNPVAGEYIIPSSTDFSFVLTPLSAAYADLVPVVTTNRVNLPDAEGVVITPREDGSYAVLIRSVQEPLRIEIDFTTGAAQIEGTKVWSTGNRLYLRTSQTGEVKVYSITGSLVKGLTAVAGETSATALPSGVYIVALSSGRVYKVIVK
jgi:hypothetical protein